MVLRLQQPIDAPIARWASTANLRVGELVLALARTRRGHIVASSGILSGLISGPMRTWRGGELDQFIRPDLNMYAGFSGGPLVNSQGEFLGLNTAGLHRSGITVPSATVQRIAAELLEKGGIQRPYLGLAMQTAALPESLRTGLNLTASEGLLVVHVEPGSPAEKAGILLGDVLIKLADEAVADTESAQRVLRRTQSGRLDCRGPGPWRRDDQCNREAGSTSGIAKNVGHRPQGTRMTIRSKHGTCNGLA